MTDAPRKAALQDLLKKVEAGEWDERLAKSICPKVKSGYPSRRVLMQMMRSFYGSLDAAMALHEAVLPGWWYNIAPTYCHVMSPKDNGDQESCSGYNDNPARAWLIAILKALIAQEAD